MSHRTKPRAFLNPISMLEDRINPVTGLLDPEFNNSGFVVESPPGFVSYTPAAVASMPDGRIVVVSTENNLITSGIRVQRYNANGSLDTTFDGNGTKNIFSGEIGTAYIAGGVTVQPDGKIVVVGTVSSLGGNEDFFVSRLNPNGSFDTTFAGDGKQSITFDLGGDNNDAATGVALQPDGKIVVVGSVQLTNDDFDFGIARLNTNGSLDTSFDLNGLQTVPFDLGGNFVDRPNAVGIDFAGRIVVVGSAEEAINKNDFAMARLNTDGSLDSSFAGGGRLTIDFGDNDTATALAFTQDGKLVVAGTWDGGQADFAVVRITESGELDSTFGGGSFGPGSGKTNASFASSGFGETEIATGVALDAFDHIVVSGHTDNGVLGGPNNFGVIRFLPDGTVDTTYGTNGRAQADLGGNDVSVGMVQQNDGRIVIVGNSNNKLAIARITGDEADIGVSITSPGTQFQIGSLVEYQVVVSNFGPEPAVVDLSVDLTTAVPDSNFVSVVTNGTVSGNTDGLGVPADRLVLGAGGQVVYTILGRVASDLVPGAFTPAASVTNVLSFDPDLSDNFDSETDFAAPLTPVLVGGPIDGSAVVLSPSDGVYSAGATKSFLDLGSARTAAADVNGDGIADLIVGSGPGPRPQIQIFDGVTGLPLTAPWFPFEEAFTGGVFVAARDLNGDSRAEVIVTPDVTGGPVVIVYEGDKLANGLNGEAAQIIRYFGIEDPAFRGGARPALGDVNGDGTPDVLIAAGFGGGPRITFWDGDSVVAQAPIQIANFFAFETALRNGAYIAAGDLTGNGFDEVAFGGGPGGAPRVRIFTGLGILNAAPFVNLDEVPATEQLANFFAGNNALRGGVRLVMKDVDADGRADLITGSGDNEPATVRLFNAVDLLTEPNPVPDQELVVFGGSILLNGVFVG